MMIKVLFLDIDGVLNSNFWNAAHQREISDVTLIDEEKIKLLALLVKRTNAKIILHSGWRTWFNSELKPLRIEAHKEVSKWVVLDDLDLHNVQIEQHQVKPDSTIGLTVEDIEKAEKILSEGNISVIL
ncbi:MAG: HAD domain-containing protein [Clostridiales bacterium]|nr:HAD domain-containing protein [Clostridiales bacterium]